MMGYYAQDGQLQVLLYILGSTDAIIQIVQEKGHANAKGKAGDEGQNQVKDDSGLYGSL